MAVKTAVTTTAGLVPQVAAQTVASKQLVVVLALVGEPALSLEMVV